MTATTFADLLAVEGVVEEMVLRGAAVGFMAFHGGALEAMTDVVARAAAERAGASYYGVVLPPHADHHVPSHRVTADQSPRLARFLAHVDSVVTVHGYGRRHLRTSLLLGGRNRALAEHVGRHLRVGLPGYDVVTDIDAIPAELRGLHHRNPVNAARGQGVQIELPPRVRGAGQMWAGWEGPGLVPHTEALVESLAAAATSWARAARGHGATAGASHRGERAAVL